MYYQFRLFNAVVLSMFILFTGYEYDFKFLLNEIKQLSVKENNLKQKLKDFQSHAEIKINNFPKKISQENSSEKNFNNDLMNMIQLSGLQLNMIKNFNFKENINLKKTFEIEVNGKFQQLYRLISSLEEYEYIVYAENFSLKVNKNNLLSNMNITISNQLKNDNQDNQEKKINNFPSVINNPFCLPKLIVH